MLAAVKGYYDGNQIIVDENERENFSIGDEVIITILGSSGRQKSETRAQKRERLIDSEAFVISTGRTAKEIDEYIREMRRDDRI